MNAERKSVKERLDQLDKDRTVISDHVDYLRKQRRILSLRRKTSLRNPISRRRMTNLRRKRISHHNRLAKSDSVL